MEKNIFNSFVLITLSAITQMVFGQGCSDAGFCTLNSFKPSKQETELVKNNQIKIGAFIGSADNSISVWGNYMEYNRQITNKFGLDARINTLAQNGNDLSVFGVSDLFLTGKLSIFKRFKLTLGTKIPLANGNRKDNSLPLSMDYQSSLGTFDLILGGGYEFNKISFVLALQQPLSQNKNEFLAENYPAGSPLRNFQSTNKFIRSGDILLRVSYPFNIGQKLTLTPSLLPIYHLANDQYTDITGVEKEISGSQGLTLNGNLYIDYELNQRNALQLNAGVPFVVRDVRPDGLTRSFVVNLEYKINF
ncbi:MAG: hypothetical protein KA458_08185 [Saprospiraceae bacterium]|nr:hypothetical protein [Candidatus Vicinibacter affinis]MBP6173502.1 hypothetical protein [Saprospiraceae bacterium]